MDLEKTLFLLSLTKDKDLPLNISYKDIVDFYEEENKFVLIVKKIENNIKHFIKYEFLNSKNNVDIYKYFDEQEDIYYSINFKNIKGRHLAQVSINGLNFGIYEFNKDAEDYVKLDKTNIIFSNILPLKEENDVLKYDDEIINNLKRK